MSFLSSLAAAGIWPALPLSGYLVFTRRHGAAGPLGLPQVTSFALMTAAGLAVWSVPLLVLALIGVYRAPLLGLAGWGLSACGLAILKRDKSVSQPDTPGRNAGAAPAPAGGKGSTESRRLRNRASRRRGHGAATDTSTAPLGSRGAEWDWVLAIGLVIVAGLYLGFPTESIYGGRDEGVYANHAVYLAHHGRLDVPYPWPADLKANLSAAWSGFPGFYQTQPLMTVQFGHLFPLWLAQAFASFGPHGLFRLNAVFALLSLAAFYGICRLAAPRPYAAVATLFLAFNPSQMWLARITLSEMFTQLCALSGLCLLLAALREKRTGLAHWAGAFFGLGAFVRLDSLLFIPLLLLSQLALRVVAEPAEDGAPVWRALYQTALPIYALAFGYYAGFSLPYFTSRGYILAGLISAAVGLLLLLLVNARVTRRLHAFLRHRFVLALTGAALFALATYAYWIRPNAGPVSTPANVWPGFTTDLARDYRLDSFINLARYLSPAVVWCALLGWFVTWWTVVRERRNTHLVVVLVMALGVSFVHLKYPLIEDHFWSIRRCVTLVIPGFVLCALLGAARVLAQLPRGLSAVAALLALAWLSIFTFRADRLILTRADDEGYFAQLQQFAEKLPRDQPILAHGYKDWPTPLYIAFDRHVIPVDLNSPAGKNAWNALVAEQVGLGQPAYLLAEVQMSDLEPNKVDEVVLSRSFSEPAMSPLPRKVFFLQTKIDLFRTTQQGELGIGDTTR